MITSLRQPIKVFASVISLLTASLLLNACGGGSSSSNDVAGVGGTGIVFGRVTGFGSVFVNGRRFETGASNFIVDGDDTMGQSALALGMVLKLKVETENGNFTGDAITVEYDDEIQGPIAGTVAANGTRKTFTIFGQTITIDETGTLFNGTSFATIAVDDVVEISGFRVSPTEIDATYVEFKESLDLGTSEIEIRGDIGSYASGPPQTFVVDGLNVTTDGSTVFDLPNGGLQNGLSVEVEGIIQTATSMLATRVEFEPNALNGDIDDVSLQGIVSNYVSLADFQIAGLAIDASSAELKPDNAGLLLGDGVEVEVEGDIVGGLLIADELEVTEGNAELVAQVDSVNLAENSFEIFYATLSGRVVVRVVSQTTFEDETDEVPSNFSINDLNANNYVKIEGREVAGVVEAKVVKRVKQVDTEKLKLQGAVDRFLFLDKEIEILGINYKVDIVNTEFEDRDGDSVSAADFFELLNQAGGDLVEIEDELPADGIADEVEFDD